MRPAEDTCGQCHKATEWHGDQLLVKHHFQSDEENTPSINVLLMKTGGTTVEGHATGIHWHANPDATVTYLTTDDKRQRIPWVKMTAADGSEKVYFTEDFEESMLATGTLRTMDCLDCHNRPSHAFQGLEEAVDLALASGRISRELSSIRAVAIDALSQDWSADEGITAIERTLRQHYANATDGGTSPAPELVDSAVRELQRIWTHNVFRITVSPGTRTRVSTVTTAVCVVMTTNIGQRMKSPASPWIVKSATR